MVAMVSGCVVTILLVSEVSREDEVAVAEVSIVLVAKVEVDGGKREGEEATELVTDLGKVT